MTGDWARRDSAISFRNSMKTGRILALSGLFLLASFAGATAADRKIAAVDGVVPGAGTSNPDSLWDRTIQDVQKALTDLGLYQGPIDGQYSAAVRRAVERFEKKYGSIGRGKALPESLRSMATVKDAVHLRNRLDETRRLQIISATQALRSNPATRDLVTRRGEPARAVSTRTCADQPTVACLLANAADSTIAVDRAYFRDWAIREVAVAEVRTGRTDHMRDRLRSLSDPRLVLVALRELVQALAQDGRTAEAAAIAETIPDAVNKVRAISSIAIAEARLGQRKQARASVERVLTMLETHNDVSGKVAIVTALASGLADAGDIGAARFAIAGARRFATAKDKGAARQVEFGMITGALANTRQFKKAMDALARLTANPAGDQSATVTSAVAKAAAAEGDRYRVTTLSNLAVVHAKLGDPVAASKVLKQAEKAAGRVREGYPAAIANFTVAKAWARIGEAERAEAVMLGLSNPVLRAKGLWEIGVLRAASGDASGAAKTEDQAFAATRNVPSAFDRTILLSDSAIARAGAGLSDQAARVFDAAWQSGRDIDAKWWRARAFARLAVALHAIEGQPRANR